jgi:hypothetical protein
VCAAAVSSGSQRNASSKSSALLNIRITLIAEVLTGPFDFQVRSNWGVDILGNARDRQRSLAKAQLLADVINTFCAELREKSKLIEKADKKARRRVSNGASKT